MLLCIACPHRPLWLWMRPHARLDEVGVLGLIMVFFVGVLPMVVELLIQHMRVINNQTTICALSDSCWSIYKYTCSSYSLEIEETLVVCNCCM
jgi:hypothetical protein